MDRRVTFHRIFSADSVEGRVDVIFNEQATSAFVEGRWVEREQAIAEAKHLAMKRKLPIGVYLLRREQWNAGWGRLI